MQFDPQGSYAETQSANRTETERLFSSGPSPAAMLIEPLPGAWQLDQQMVLFSLPTGSIPLEPFSSTSQVDTAWRTEHHATYDVQH
jgi:hypothetical protein